MYANDGVEQNLRVRGKNFRRMRVVGDVSNGARGCVRIPLVKVLLQKPA